MNKIRISKKAEALISSAYGKKPTRAYSDAEEKKIASSYDLRPKKADFSVDDTTWHDLDMAAVYRRVNACFSSSGDEALYRMMREPLLNRDAIRQRDASIAYLSSHEDERKALSASFIKIGRTKKISLVEYLVNFTAPDQGSAGEIVSLVLLALAIAALFLNPLAGIVSIIAVMIFNIASYFRTKAKVESLYGAVAAMSYLERSALELSRTEIPELSYLLDPIHEISSKLTPLKRGIRILGDAGRGVVSLGIFDVLMDYVRMITHIDFLVFRKMAKTVDENRDELLRMLDALGEIEALISIASYRETVPYFTPGEFLPEDDRSFTIEDAIHPLIEKPVPNSISVSSPVLLTGSNASGKSTFLRTAALTVLLAESIATAPAKTLKTPLFRVYTSMALQDNLEGGESYFIVEIRSIKRIMEASAIGGPVFCCIDEVLRGTNTVERIAASSEILADFASRNVFVFAATHDTELTSILDGTYEKYHFSEEVRDGEVVFDYKLKKGPASSRNAIKLLSAMGYRSDVVERAEETAEHFLREGTWKLY